MKYLKTYENSNKTYKDKVGKTIIYFGPNNDERIGRLFDITGKNHMIINKYPNDEKKFDFINDYDIIRIATPEDIEEFEIKNDAEKYNL